MSCALVGQFGAACFYVFFFFALGYLASLILALYVPSAFAHSQIEQINRYLRFDALAQGEPERLAHLSHAQALAAGVIAQQFSAAIGAGRGPLAHLRKVATSSEVSAQALLLGAMFWVFSLAAAGPAQWVALSLIGVSLWAMSKTDALACEVFDRDIFVLALVCASATLFGSSPVSWTSAQGALGGFVAMGIIVSLLYGYFALKRWLASKPDNPLGQEAVFFGEGDTLILLALSLYFGFDVLLIVLVASLVFVVSVLIEALWPVKSHFAGRWQPQMALEQPFAPAIFVATVVVCALRPGFSLNPEGLAFVQGVSNALGV